MTNNAPTTTSVRAVARLVGIGIFALIMTGCASMSEEECLSVNWTDKGYHDGRAGWPLSRKEDHRKACAEVAVALDDAQYQAGHTRGIVEYCTPANGLQTGLAGSSYRNSCPVKLAGAFLANYRVGYGTYSARKEVRDLNNSLDSKERSFRNEKDNKKRENLRSEIRSLERKLYYANQNLRSAEIRLRQWERDQRDR